MMTLYEKELNFELRVRLLRQFTHHLNWMFSKCDTLKRKRICLQVLSKWLREITGLLSLFFIYKTKMKPLISLNCCETQDSIIMHCQQPEDHISHPLCPYHHLSGILIHSRISTPLPDWVWNQTVKGSDHGSTTGSHFETSVFQSAKWAYYY